MSARRILWAMLVTPLLALGACSDRSIEITPEHGITLQDRVIGAGAPVVEGSTVRAHYVVRLPDGTVLTDTRTAGNGEPHEWVVGDNTIIPGMNVAVMGMKMGGVRRAIIPPRSGYGKMGYAGKIPPNTDIIIDIELQSTLR